MTEIGVSVGSVQFPTSNSLSPRKKEWLRIITYLAAMVGVAVEANSALLRSVHTFPGLFNPQQKHPIRFVD